MKRLGKFTLLVTFFVSFQAMAMDSKQGGEGTPPPTPSPPPILKRRISNPLLRVRTLSNLPGVDDELVSLQAAAAIVEEREERKKTLHRRSSSLLSIGLKQLSSTEDSSFTLAQKLGQEVNDEGSSSSSDDDPDDKAKS